MQVVLQRLYEQQQADEEEASSSDSEESSSGLSRETLAKLRLRVGL